MRSIGSTQATIARSGSLAAQIELLRQVVDVDRCAALFVVLRVVTNTEDLLELLGQGFGHRVDPLEVQIARDQRC
jgi:hypothetical protein